MLCHVLLFCDTAITYCVTPFDIANPHFLHLDFSDEVSQFGPLLFLTAYPSGLAECLKYWPCK